MLLTFEEQLEDYIKFWEGDNYPKKGTFAINHPIKKEKRWLEFSVEREETSDSQYELYGTVYDITERKNMLLKYELLEHVCNTVGEGIWLYDEAKKEHIIYNKAETDITGLTANDYNDHPYAFNLIISKKDKDRIHARFVLESKKRNSFIERYEITNYKTKEVKKLNVSTNWVTIDGNNYIFGITRDLTNAL